jgi:Ca2+/H+ antiporter, TMEM165/GDT1 family
MLDWTHAGPSLVAAFLASLVEFVEALTVVLAVGVVRGWRPALLGTGFGLAVLFLLVLLLGPALARIPLDIVQLAVGTLLLLFGLRWLRKAILRAAGVIAMHDEARIYQKETELMRDAGAPPARASFDIIAFLASFKAVTLEGLEVIFIVIAIGAGGSLLLASLGAAMAALVIILLGFALRRPLARVPENLLKFVVGIMLTAFGVFWIGEGLTLPWPGHDLALLGMIALLVLLSMLGVRIARGRAAVAP